MSRSERSGDASSTNSRGRLIRGAFIVGGLAVVELEVPRILHLTPRESIGYTIVTFVAMLATPSVHRRIIYNYRVKQQRDGEGPQSE